MICIYCKSEIENDCFYCDQCGKEILICPLCGKTGKGKKCINDGNTLVSAKQNNPNATPMNTSMRTSVPVLRLVNTTLNIDITIRPEEIIGRLHGNYSKIFSAYHQISERHVQFLFNPNQGWMLQDLGSTNGTALNHLPEWQGVAKLKPQNQVAIQSYRYLLLANIELQIIINQ
ncbi:MAG: FHA domain-containing protein [Methylacidiphilales bacterium]|nr:FHA domain-containing protein [Candidatus Methylacidiphilales bacterium]